MYIEREMNYTFDLSLNKMLLCRPSAHIRSAAEAGLENSHVLLLLKYCPKTCISSFHTVWIAVQARPPKPSFNGSLTLGAFLIPAPMLRTAPPYDAMRLLLHSTMGACMTWRVSVWSR